MVAFDTNLSSDEFCHVSNFIIMSLRWRKIPLITQGIWVFSFYKVEILLAVMNLFLIE